MAVNERETQEPLYPRNHPYSPSSGVGTPDEQDLLQAEVLELRGRTARAELRAEVLTRALAPFQSATGPYVLAFAVEMERKLAKNRHKGDREGWCNDAASSLMVRCEEELRELRSAILLEPNASYLPLAVVSEAADVANFAMMVADVASFSVSKAADTFRAALRTPPQSPAPAEPRCDLPFSDHGRGCNCGGAPGPAPEGSNE